MIQIRYAGPDDIGPILAMQKQIHAEHLAWDAARWGVVQPIEPAYRAWLGELVSASGSGLVLVAVSGVQIAGYLIAEVEEESTRHWSPRAVYLHDLFVDPSSRRSGVARQLMDAFIEWTNAHQPWLAIRLITATKNDAARAFFARFGFRPCAVEMVRER